MALTPLEKKLLREAVSLLGDDDPNDRKAARLIEGVINDTEEDGKARQPSAEERASVLGGLVSASKAPGDLTQGERMKLAKEGKAMPDGSFPIRHMGDLTEHAMPSFGRASDKAAAKAHMLKRAKALGAPGGVVKQIQSYST